MPPPRVVEALDVIEHVGLGLGSSAVHLCGRAFSFQRGEEALHHRIVPDVARPTHAAGDAVVGQEALEWLTRLQTPSIGGMRHGVGRTPSPDRHHECIGDQLGSHRRTHRPPDHPSREEIHDRGDVEPAFGGPEIREVGAPFAVGRRGVERPVEHIRGAGVFAERAPVSDGIRRRLGRARKAACRISRSMRWRPQAMPSTSRSCLTRRAP